MYIYIYILYIYIYIYIYMLHIYIYIYRERESVLATRSASRPVSVRPNCERFSLRKWPRPMGDLNFKGYVEVKIINGSGI